MREGNNFKVPVVDRMIILKCVFEKWDEGRGLDRFGSG
jgi:hypothetical protein